MIKNRSLSIKRKINALLLPLFLVLLVFSATGCGNTDSEDLSSASETQVDIPGDAPGAAQDAASGDSSVTVVDDDSTDSGKMVDVALESVGRANPFLPSKEGKLLADKAGLNFDLMEPPVTPQPDEYTQKVMATKISGIMFDKENPSAILNIEDTDYLVRSGDVINGYKILAISPSTVTVQLGPNIYKAGVGEVVDDGELNMNTVPNLSSKFGGAKQ